MGRLKFGLIFAGYAALAGTVVLIVIQLVLNYPIAWNELYLKEFTITCLQMSLNAAVAAFLVSQVFYTSTLEEIESGGTPRMHCFGIVLFSYPAFLFIALVPIALLNPGFIFNPATWAWGFVLYLIVSFAFSCWFTLPLVFWMAKHIFCLTSNSHSKAR